MMQSAHLLIFSGSDANMRYASGIDLHDPFIWIRLGAHEYLLVSSLEYGRVRKEARPGQKIVMWEKVELGNIRKPSMRRRNLADIAAAFLISYNITEVHVPENTWALHMETLREHSLRVRIAEPFFPQRHAKSKAEIAAIKRAGLVAKKAMHRAVEILKESKIEWDDTLLYGDERLTSERLRAQIEKVFLDHGCTGTGTIVACGAQAAQPHNTGSGPIYAGQPIVVDLFPRDNASGYYFDVTRTFVKGTPSPELRRMYNAVKKAHSEALSVVAPGKASLVHQTAAEVFERLGYRTTDEEGFIHSTGHGLGLDLHEWPRVSAKSDDVLIPGAVITIEPGLYYNDLGGIRIEDTVMVTKAGCVNLTNLPKAWIIR